MTRVRVALQKLCKQSDHGWWSLSPLLLQQVLTAIYHVQSMQLASLRESTVGHLHAFARPYFSAREVQGVVQLGQKAPTSS